MVFLQATAAHLQNLRRCERVLKREFSIRQALGARTEAVKIIEKDVLASHMACKITQQPSLLRGSRFGMDCDYGSQS